MDKETQQFYLDNLNLKQKLVLYMLLTAGSQREMEAFIKKTYEDETDMGYKNFYLEIVATLLQRKN